MSFSSQRAVFCLIDSGILILVANWLYKTPIVLKRQRFENSRSDKMELRGLKRQRLDLRNNEEEKSLDEFEGEGEGKGIGYVPFPFIAPLQKESNRPTNMGKRTKTLNQLICILKIG